MKNKIQIQSDEYIFPYHHLVDFENPSFSKIWDFGIEYYFYCNEILNILKEMKFDTLADVGCGDGKITIEFAKRNCGKNIYGFDIDSRSIYYAKAFSANLKNIFFNNEDFDRTDISFDIITLIEVLEHIPPDKIKYLIKTCYEKLNNDGVIIISVPTINNKNIPEKHYKHYDYEELSKDVGEYFDIKECKFVYKKNLLITFIEKILTNKIFCIVNNVVIKFAISFLKRLQNSVTKNNGRHLIVVLKKKD